MTTAFLVISLRWKITLLKQRGLCELTEIAETFSVVLIRKGFQVVYLFDCMKTREPRSINSKNRKIWHRRGKKFPLNWGCFRKMNFVACRSTYHSSCYRIEYRTSKNSDERAWASERVLRKRMWLQLTVCKYVDNLSFLRQTQQIRTPRNLDMKRYQIL